MDMIMSNNEMYTRVINDVLNSGILDLGNSMYEKDKKTFRHCQRVFDHCFLIGLKLSLTIMEFECLAIAAFYHDVGDIEIPDTILDKAGAFANAEKTVMETHPRISANMLRLAGGSEDAVKTLACHHERYDGKGHPYGLHGENIPLLARILAVADAYDSMTSKTGVMKTIKNEEAIDRLMLSSGTLFDPEVAGSLIKQIETSHMCRLGTDEKVEVA